MFRTLLALTPYLLAAPVAAAPALVDRDVCNNNLVTKTAWVTATVTVQAGGATAAVSVQQQKGQSSAGTPAYQSPKAPQASNVGNPPRPYGNETNSGGDRSRGGYESSLYFTNWCVRQDSP